MTARLFHRSRGAPSLRALCARMGFHDSCTQWWFDFAPDILKVLAV